MNQGYKRVNAISGEEPLTNLSVEDLFLSVANWFNDLDEGLEESEVTQSPGLVIELLPLRILQAGKKQRPRIQTIPLSFFMKGKVELLFGLPAGWMDVLEKCRVLWGDWGGVKTQGSIL